MSVTVQIPTALRQYAGGLAEVVVEAATAGEALQGLVAQHEGLRKHLYREDGQLRNFVNVYVGDEDIRYLSGANTPVAEGGKVLLVPAIAGGAATVVDYDEDEVDVVHYDSVPAHSISACQPGESCCCSGCDCGSAASADTPPVAPEAARASLNRAADGLPELNNEEVARYSRHLILPEVGVEGQRKLKQARVLLIGTGGLGAPLGMYLAAAGVGHIGVVDFDSVDTSNLQRQIIHGTRDVGRPKVASAVDRLRDINPHVEIRSYETRLSSRNALEIIKDYDIVVDGTDNFPTRYLVNDACVLLGKPNVYGSIFRFEGQASVFGLKDGPCYRCLYPEPPAPGLVPSCAEGGVLGVLPGIIGTIQANETIKLILGGGEPLVGRLLLFDAWAMRFRELKLRKNPACPLCGEHPSITGLIDYEHFCGIKPAAKLTPEEEGSIPAVTATELKQKIDSGQDIQLIDIRGTQEFAIARLPGVKLIPYEQLAARAGEIDPEREAVLICKLGTRSAQAIRDLRAAGFTGNIKNLQGGIIAWADEVDPSLPRY